MELVSVDMKSNFNIKNMAAIREIQFTGTLKDKWPDVKDFIFNDVLKDIDVSDIDKISVHEITSDVVCNGKCFKPKKGSGRGYKLSVSVNLKRVSDYYLTHNSIADTGLKNKWIQIYIKDAKEMFLMLLCHELYHYLASKGGVKLTDFVITENSEGCANWFAAKQLIKWREKK